MNPESSVANTTFTGSAHVLAVHDLAVYVTAAAELFSNAQAEGAEIIKPLQDESWGMREFALRTPDGHRIMIGEPIDPAG